MQKYTFLYNKFEKAPLFNNQNSFFIHSQLNLQHTDDL